RHAHGSRSEPQCPNRSCERRRSPVRCDWHGSCLRPRQVANRHDPGRWLRMDISSRALMIQGVDGRVRFTTRSGTVFEAELIRTELSPTTVVVRPVGFEVEIEGFVPAQLRLLASKLRGADRPGEQPPEPDLGALVK